MVGAIGSMEVVSADIGNRARADSPDAGGTAKRIVDGVVESDGTEGVK